MIEGTIDNVKDLAVSSLVSIARQCDLAANVDGTARFVRMLHELYFSAKVNSRRPKPSEVYKSLQTHSIPEHKSRDYMSAGSRWAFLANAGSLYLLLVIAFKGEDEYFRKKASVTVIQALCNKIRAPDSSGITGEIVRSLLRDLGLSGSFDCGDLRVNDNYFGSFFFHTFRSLPRDWEAWKQFDVSMKSEQQTGAAQHASAVSELSSEEETLTPPSTVPPISILFNRMGFQSQDSEGIHQVLFTPYKPAKTKEPFPPDYRGRSKWTENERSLAQDCVTPDSLESYASEMNGRFDSLGRLSDSSKVVQIFNDNKDLLYTLDTTMPQHLKEGLERIIQACLSGTTAQLTPQDPSSSVQTAAFSSLHFTNQTRYLTHGYEAPKDIHPLYLVNANGGKMNHSQLLVHPSEDIQKFSGPFKDLKQSLEETLRWVSEKIHPDTFHEISATVDLLPLQDTSPASPFTSIVFNINVSTLAHRDKNNKSACICITVGNPQGVIHADKTGYLLSSSIHVREMSNKEIPPDSSSLSSYHPWVNGEGETYESLTEKEANYLLRIANAQEALCSAEQAALDQKIAITKLIMELHFCRLSKIQMESSEARQNAVRMEGILSKIQGCDNSVGACPATPNTPPSMELDYNDTYDDEDDIYEPWEDEAEPHPPTTDGLKDQNTEICYFDEGCLFLPFESEFIALEALQEVSYWIEENEAGSTIVFSGHKRRHFEKIRP
ncbi:hypothetical protein C8J55DRAFT_489896 [Lentinula edodes]|uniref:Uncharacterized protein n=1 Tax=Lentinula lateritia TaxID=40482 RepID=A0A9W9A895_9AGAR|nr:hypothetical protein C8J55DRAFT_489896 [Lentinula edodes]